MQNPASTARVVDIFVRDRHGRPIPGAEIRFAIDGSFAGRIPNAEGRGRIHVPDKDARIDVIASYLGKTREVHLSQSQDTYTFKFDVAVGWTFGEFMERHIALIVGLVLIAAAITLAFVFTNPNTLQVRVILGTFSLAGGAIATEISGMVKIDMTLGTKLTIGATGALAVFVILYLVVPA